MVEGINIIVLKEVFNIAPRVGSLKNSGSVSILNADYGNISVSDSLILTSGSVTNGDSRNANLNKGHIVIYVGCLLHLLIEHVEAILAVVDKTCRCFVI